MLAQNSLNYYKDILYIVTKCLVFTYMWIFYFARIWEMSQNCKKILLVNNHIGTKMSSFFSFSLLLCPFITKKSRKRETLNLSTCADSSTDTKKSKIYIFERIKKCQVSFVTCHVSGVRCHLSPVTCH